MAAARVHPTAIVEDGAELADDVVIEANAFISAGSRIGEGTRVRHGAVVEGQTTLGKHNLLYPYAILGGDPQDLKFDGEESALIVGDHNVFREHTTVNKGTANGGGATRIGDHNLFMANTHVGHDCFIGNHCIFSFNCGLAGHIEVGDHAILGGMVGVHQFVRIGSYAFASGGSKFGMDLSPYTICQGIPSRLRGVNTVGLQRQGFDAAAIKNIRLAYRRYFLGAETSAEDRCEAVRAAFGEDLPPEIETFITFVTGASERGIMHPAPRRRHEDGSESEEV